MLIDTEKAIFSGKSSGQYLGGSTWREIELNLQI